MKNLFIAFVWTFSAVSVFASLIRPNDNWTLPQRRNSTQIKVAVIDTGLDLNDPRFKGKICDGSKDFTGTGLRDNHGHGTHIAGLIMKYAKDANFCMLIIKNYNVVDDGHSTAYLKNAIQYAIDERVNIVNYSGGGDGENEEERQLIMSAPWLLFVVGAGNYGKDLKDRPYYPASYGFHNLIPIGALDKDNERASYSNYGELVKVWEIGEAVSSVPNTNRCKDCTKSMRGTSQAAAITTGKMLSGTTPKGLTSP